MDMTKCFRAVFLGLSLLVGCSQASTDDYAQAQERLKRGDEQAAIISLKNVLKKTPSHIDARYAYAKILISRGQYESALQTLRSNSSSTNASKLIDLQSVALLELGKVEETLSLTKSTSLTPLQKGVRIEALIRKGLMEEASALAKEEILDQVQDAKLAASLISVVIFQEGENKASALLQKLITRFPDSSELWELKGDLEQSMGRASDAIESYSRSLGQMRFPNQAMLKRALIRVAKGDVEKASEDIDLLIKVYPKHPGVNYAKGILHLRTAQNADAAHAFELARAQEQFYPKSRLLESKARMALGEVERARTLAQQYWVRHPQDPEGVVQLAMSALQIGDFEQVEALLTPLLKSNPGSALLTELMAGALAGKGQNSAAADLLLPLMQRSPKPELRQKTAVLLFASGRLDEAAALVNAVEVSGTTVIEGQLWHLTQIFSSLREGMADKAIDEAKLFKQNFAQYPTPFNLLSQLLLGQQRVVEAEVVLKEALGRFPGNVYAARQLAQLARERNEFVPALALLADARRAAPHNLALIVETALLHVDQGDYSTAEKLLRDANDNASGNLQLVLPLLELQMKRGYLKDGERILSSLDASLRQLPSVKRVEALLYEAQERYVESERLLSSLLRVAPDPQLYLRLSRVQQALNKQNESVNTLLNTAVTFPQTAVIAAVIEELLRIKSVDKAKGLLDKHQDDFETKQRMALGVTVALADGFQDVAFKQATELLEAFPESNSLAIYMRSAQVAGHTIQAIDKARTWLVDHPKDPAITLLLAAFEESAGNRAEAEGLYRRVLADNPKSAHALNGLAWLWRDSRTHATEALDMARQAFEFAPGNSAFADTLLTLLIRQGRLQEAQEITDAALVQRPADRTIRYYRAAVARLSGDLAQAKNLLNTLLSDPQPFRQRRQAEQLLASLQ